MIYYALLFNDAFPLHYVMYRCVTNDLLRNIIVK